MHVEKLEKNYFGEVILFAYSNTGYYEISVQNEEGTVISFRSMSFDKSYKMLKDWLKKELYKKDKIDIGRRKKKNEKIILC